MNGMRLRKVLVTGGTGVVGAAAVRALLAAGHRLYLFAEGGCIAVEGAGTHQ